MISLGPYVAPAGSTLVLQATYAAAFGAVGKQGLWRSAAYPSAASTSTTASAAGSLSVRPVVALSTEFEMNAARTVLPCLDQPGYKVSVGRGGEGAGAREGVSAGGLACR